jgi:hypothetical protein
MITPAMMLETGNLVLIKPLQTGYGFVEIFLLFRDPIQRYIS